MRSWCGISLAATLTLLAAMHIYWLLGGQRGSRVVIPESDGRPAFTPSAAATVAVALCLFLAAALVLGRLGWWDAALAAFVHPGFYRIGVWGVAAAFALRAIGDFRYVGLFKRVRGTVFARWDDRLFTPLCAAMCTLAALVAAA